MHRSGWEKEARRGQVRRGEIATQSGTVTRALHVIITTASRQMELRMPAWPVGYRGLDFLELGARRDPRSTHARHFALRTVCHCAGCKQQTITAAQGNWGLRVLRTARPWCERFSDSSVPGDGAALAALVERKWELVQSQSAKHLEIDIVIFQPPRRLGSEPR